MPKAFQRALAIHPTTKGFGFVVMEGRNQLVDWGLKETKKKGLDARLALLDRLLVRYSPRLFIIEAYDPQVRRSDRARELIARTLMMASNREIKVRVVTRAQVRSHFEPRGAKTKFEVARLVAQRFPELAALLPAPRPAWMSEDARMSIFWAQAAMLLTMQR